MLSRLSKNINDECHICLEKKTKKDIIVLSCMHSFHASCLYDWFEKNDICPICMKKKNIFFTSISKYSCKKKKQIKEKQCCIIL